MKTVFGGEIVEGKQALSEKFKAALRVLLGEGFCQEPDRRWEEGREDTDRGKKGWN